MDSSPTTKTSRPDLFSAKRLRSTSRSGTGASTGTNSHACPVNCSRISLGSANFTPGSLGSLIVQVRPVQFKQKK